MGAFSPFKKHANKFNYKPRYYDPTKEAREQRRAEMSGKRSDSSKEEYKPGDYIRNQSAARAAKRLGSGSGRRSKMWLMIIAIIALAYMGSVLYNKLIDIFLPSTDPTEQTRGVHRSAKELEEFDPYAPITVVPNDYDPNK